MPLTTPYARTLVLATRSSGKLRELRASLADLDIVVVDLAAAGIARVTEEDAVEVGATFAENALAKARYFHARAGGLPTLADDSGLEVQALDGAPGVRSRRYAGALGSEAEQSAANNAKLLLALEGIADRRARFVCALAYVEGAREIVCTGATEGSIVERPSGRGGFGYDPLFASDALGGLTFGVASADEKARVSHRGRALTALRTALARDGARVRAT